MSSLITKEEEKPIYDRIVTILNYHFGNYHDVMTLNDVACSYTETYGADIEKDFRKFGYPSLTAFLRHLNFTITPCGKISTFTNPSNKNGVNDMIELMRKTTSRFGGSRITNEMQQTPITYVPSTEVEKPLGPPPVPRQRRALSAEKPPESTKRPEFLEINNWSEAGLPDSLMENIKKANFVKPRQIQKVAIPLILDNYDITCYAETGSGKTTAYLIPIISAAIEAKANGTLKSEPGHPYAIITTANRDLVRELCDQVHEFADGTGTTCAMGYEKLPVNLNCLRIQKGSDILVVSPGRCKHLIDIGVITFNKLRFLVFDEGDHLSSSPFLSDIRTIIQFPSFPQGDRRQTIFFFSTFSNEMLELAKEFMCPLAHISISNIRGGAEQIIKDEECLNCPEPPQPFKNSNAPPPPSTCTAIRPQQHQYAPTEGKKAASAEPDAKLRRSNTPKCKPSAEVADEVKFKSESIVQKTEAKSENPKTESTDLRTPDWMKTKGQS